MSDKIKKLEKEIKKLKKEIAVIDKRINKSNEENILKAIDEHSSECKIHLNKIGTTISEWLCVPNSDEYTWADVGSLQKISSDLKDICKFIDNEDD